MISCLGAPTRHLLMPRDPLQLSSVVTSQYSKTIFWKKFPENPLSHAPKVCLYGLMYVKSLPVVISGDAFKSAFPLSHPRLDEWWHSMVPLKCIQKLDEIHSDINSWFPSLFYHILFASHKTHVHECA